MKLLHLDSSILGAASASRELSAEIVGKLTSLHPGIAVTYHDLAVDTPLHLSGAHLAAWHGAPVQDPALAKDLAAHSGYIDELVAADIVVIGAPMYNFSVSTQLKGWIDRVVVAGKTFRYGPMGQPESLLPKGKRVFIAASRGGIYSTGSPAAFLEHHETYLRGVLGFIGLTDVTVMRAEGLAIGPEARSAAIGKANEQVAALVS